MVLACHLNLKKNHFCISTQPSDVCRTLKTEGIKIAITKTFQMEAHNVPVRPSSDGEAIMKPV